MSLRDELRLTAQRFLSTATTHAETEPPAHSRSKVMSLPALGAQLKETSVSGVSSGGAMAMQFHVAHSAHLKGVGITAGIAYESADSRQAFVPRIMRGVYKSMKGIAYTEPNAQEVAQFSIERTEEALAAGGIDDPKNLAGQRIWLFHGKLDTKVARQAMDGLRAYYLNYVEPWNVFYMDDLAAPHAQINDDYGQPADFENTDDHIIDLDYDAPGELLQLIYGTLHDNKDVYHLDHLLPFDQSEFVGYWEGETFKRLRPESVGLANTGYVYIPSDYEPDKGRVHVAFHGCDQYADETMGFVKESGYNEWAEKNNIIILYPQSIGTSVPFNPKGCWDWFGYAAPTAYRTQYARKNGYQIGAVWRMLNRLSEGMTARVPSDTFGRPLKVQGDVTDISVALVWQQNLAAESFDVHRKNPDTGDFEKVNEAPVVGFSYVDRPPLKPDTEYEYQITSTSPAGERSAPSDVLKVRTLPENGPPRRYFG